MALRLPNLPEDPLAPFPPPERALRAPAGLLAIGGDLSPVRLLHAYRHGIFPWYADGQPILWWTPDPRMVFRSDGVHLSSRFRRGLRHSPWMVRADTGFEAVIDACAHLPRRGQHGSWITQEMRAVYCELHRRGHAHSIEVFDDARMVGGLYGVACGRMFFAESMFSAHSGGSKVALAALGRRLQAWGWPLIDAQIENPHLLRLGAEAWPRARFLRRIAELVAVPEAAGPWTRRFAELPAAVLAR